MCSLSQKVLHDLVLVHARVISQSVALVLLCHSYIFQGNGLRKTSYFLHLSDLFDIGFGNNRIAFDGLSGQFVHDAEKVRLIILVLDGREMFVVPLHVHVMFKTLACINYRLLSGILPS